jgi:lipoprotein-releasing system permease protein
MANLDWFLARRYLGARRSQGFLSLITWIALGGITVGVTALIVVLAVMTGAQEDLRSGILGSTPHVMVLQQGPSLRLDDWRTVRDSIMQLEEVVAAAPFLLTKVAITRGDPGSEYAQTADLYGVSTEAQEIAVTEMEADIQAGDLPLGPTESGLPPLILGDRLADRMLLFPGDTVLLVSLENVRTDAFGGYNPAIRRFEVTGTFSTGMYDFDIRNIYAPIPAAQDLLSIQDEGRVSGIGVRIQDPWAAAEVGRNLRTRLGFPYFVESWITTNRALFSALRLEKLAMGLILFLIGLVAAFNIISTLVMVVADKTREIGILKAMGMPDRRILRVFIYQGLWIGIIGTVLGAAFGLGLSWLLDTYEIIRIPPDVYFVDRLPISLRPLDVVLIVVATIAVAFLATVYPALQASRLEPVEAIRHE